MLPRSVNRSSQPPRTDRWNAPDGSPTGWTVAAYRPPITGKNRTTALEPPGSVVARPISMPVTVLTSRSV